jgi:membrane protease YdiL (CAAX protease family)
MIKFLTLPCLFMLPYFLSFPYKFMIFTPLFSYFLIKKFKVEIRSNFRFKAFLLYLSFYLLLFFCAFNLIPFLGAKEGIELIPVGKVWLFSSLFQAFQEELFFKFLLLKLWQKLPRFYASFLMACFFTLLHFLLYRVGIEDVLLEPSCLGTLFLFNFSTNLLFSKTQNLLLVYLLHAGWNTPRFAYEYYLMGYPLKEGTTFNLFEGSFILLMISFVFFLFSLLFYYLYKPQTSPLLLLCEPKK